MSRWWRGGGLILGILAGLVASCGSDDEPAQPAVDAGSHVPVVQGCRDSAWRERYTAEADGPVPLDGAGRVELEIASGERRILLNPHGITPLSAVVAVAGIDPACVRTVSMRVKAMVGEDLAMTWPEEEIARFELDGVLASGEVGVPVLGLYAAHDNEVTVTLEEEAAVHRAVVTVSTESLDPSMPHIEIVSEDRDSMEPGWNLAAFSASDNGFRARPFIYDDFGRIRWVLHADEAISPGFVTPMEPLRNGNLVLAYGNAVYEYSLLGREVNRWLLPNGFEQHHDVFEMPDGHLLVCGKNHQSEGFVTGSGDRVTSSDEVIEIDRKTGAVRNVWDLRLFFDVDRYTHSKTGGGEDWFHLNSVVYSPQDDSIIVSGKHQGVAKISRGGVNVDDPRAGKELRWILAPHLGWDCAGGNGTGMELGPFLLTAVDENGTPWPDEVQEGLSSSADFGWVYSQHAPVLLDDGDLFIFDNGEQRDLDSYTGENFSRGVVFHIEPAGSGVGGTVRQVWEYGRERGQELFSPVISDVDVGPETGNRFIMPGAYTTSPDGTTGGAAKVVEVRPSDGRVVFEAHIVMRGNREWGDDMCYRQERMVFGTPRRSR